MEFARSLSLAFVLLIAPTSFAYTQTETISHPTDNTITTTVKVKGITCSTDLAMISTNVMNINGVNMCQAGKQGPTSTFEISFNSLLVTEEDIFSAIENTGSCENPEERPYKVKQ